MALWQLPPSRVPLLPNPVDPFFLESITPRYETLPAHYWLHVGSNAWYKNRQMVLRIHAELLARGVRIPLLLIGSPLNGEETALLTSLKSTKWVTTLSNVDDSLVRSAYAHAEGLIFPSLEEGFGWPVLEAMAQGCPVYCSNRAPLTELAGDVGMLIDPLDPAAAAELIDADWRDGTLRAERLERGRQHAATYCLKDYGMELKKLYDIIGGMA